MRLIPAAGLPAPELPDAACRHSPDPDVWFAWSDGATATARAVCEDCPVQLACLEYALDNEEMWGIWGGRTPQERETLRRRISAEHPGTARGRRADTSPMPVGMSA